MSVGKRTICVGLSVAAGVSISVGVLALYLSNRLAFNSTVSTTHHDLFFTNLFKVYMPRHACMYDESPLIWLHLISDAVIALAYFSIPVALVKLVRSRRDLKFNGIFICFAVFILACGAGHVLNVIAIWSPVYRFEGIVKLITAIASVATAVVLWPMIPKIISIPSAATLLATNEELRLSSERLRRLIESAKEYAIFMLDPQGCIQTWNIGAQRLKGYTAEQAIGKHFSIFYSEEDRAAHKPANELRIATTAGQYEEDGWRVRADGSRFQANVLFTAIRDGNGTLLGFSKITRDLTERKKGEAQIVELNNSLRSRNLSLEAANKELEAFSYSVSHDLRAPLRSIDGFSKAILEDGYDKLDQPCREHLQRVRLASQRMGQLIDDLLNLSRVSRGDFRHRQVDLAQTAREVIEECRARAPERCISVKIPTQMIVEADPRLMRVMLTNLIGNAWKFTGKTEDAVIEFGRAGENGQAECFVRDNGVGFSMEYVGKLFGAFQRLHSEKEFPGTGIGLATVQRIIHRHGGEVRAQSKPGEGATFYFTLGDHQYAASGMSRTNN
jgi:PAS domain S-box-containing protein